MLFVLGCCFVLFFFFLVDRLCSLDRGTTESAVLSRVFRCCSSRVTRPAAPAHLLWVGVIMLRDVVMLADASNKYTVCFGALFLGSMQLFSSKAFFLFAWGGCIRYCSSRLLGMFASKRVMVFVSHILSTDIVIIRLAIRQWAAWWAFTLVNPKHSWKKNSPYTEENLYTKPIYLLCLTLFYVSSTMLYHSNFKQIATPTRV